MIFSSKARPHENSETEESLIKHQTDYFYSNMKGH